MTNHDHDARADHNLSDDADTETAALWEDLAVSLGCYLSAINTHSRHNLVIEFVGPEPQPDPEAQDLYPYVIFSSRSDALLHAEIPSNLMLHPRYALDDDACEFFRTTGWDTGEIDWYLDFPLEDADEVAGSVMRAFRQHFRVAHPPLLTYRVWGAAGPDGALLGLCGTEDIPLDQPIEAPAGGTGDPPRRTTRRSPSNRRLEPPAPDHRRDPAREVRSRADGRR